MTIASTTLALAPNLYYALDDTSGTTAPNLGSLANDGTYSGSMDRGMPGPEIGTFSTRLLSTGQIQSIAMDVTAYRDLTMSLWFSMDASGLTGTIYPIMGIGDVANRMSRGPVIYESHTTVGVPRLGYRWNASANSFSGTTDPTKGWHNITVTWTLSPANMRAYVDGQLMTTTAQAGPVAALTSDPLLIRSDQPIWVAHAAVWLRVLTQTELQTYTNQISTWQGNAPINTPPPSGGGGGGGLTEDQAAQLEAIDTKTDDIPGLVAASTYISDQVNVIRGFVEDTWTNQLPNLQATVTSIGEAIEGVHEKLDAMRDQIDAGFSALSDQIGSGGGAVGTALTEIRNAVAATISTATGDIATTVGQLLSRPSRDATESHPLALETCEPIDLDVSLNALYGVTLRILSYPPDVQWRTPDHAWAYNDLAVLTFEIGGVITERHGIHTLTHTVTPLPDSLPFGAGVVTAWLQPPGYHIKVDWLPGVCGELVGLIWPHG